MTTKRRLPVITERALADVKALQIKTGHSYVMHLRQARTVTTCRKGCASCCSHPFLISIAEGVLLYRWLHDNNQWTSAVRRRFAETRDKVLGVSFEAWLLSNLPCPVLNEAGECSAYEARPLRCRVTYSMGDPGLCRPNELGPKTPFVNSADTIIEFTRASLAVLKKAGVRDGSLMPLPEAVLLGEAIENGKLDIKEAALQHLKDLMNG